MLNRRQTYAALGFFLGLGAPVGALTLRYVSLHEAALNLWLRSEIHSHQFFYVYMATSTVIAFALFGYLIGGRTSELEGRTAILEESSDRLAHLSMTDSLTGLYNHRYLQERLELEMERSRRYESPLSVLMLDIDDFKKVNDQYGHVFGDRVLTEVTQILQESVRTVDILGRYGGEEFLVILPETSEETARQVAERIRQSIADHRVPLKSGQDIRVTVTIGEAFIPFPGLVDRVALVKAADEALYEGKRNGKNRLVCYHRP